MFSETVAALATARGEASVGIIRLSGPDAATIAMSVYRKPSGLELPVLPNERTLLYGVVCHPETKRVLDEVIMVWMPGPHSYTGEDVVELQVHGGARVMQQVLDAVLRAGCRLAEPGEFTKRAFLNGRVDLSQAEAVIDLIRAKTDLASAAAIRQVRGDLRKQVTSIRKRLLRLQAYVEVSIDYPEHEVEDEARQQVTEVCTTLLGEVRTLAETGHMGQILRDGVSTVIVGRPNVGKSSLMNALLRRDRAIVTEIPGTTRDVLEEYVNLQGIPFRIMDTAGIRETTDVVERIGVERSRASLAEAEIAVLMVNANEALDVEDERLFAETAAVPRVVLVNKVDLGRRLDPLRVRDLAGNGPVLELSLKDQLGFGTFVNTLVALAVGPDVQNFDATYATNARQTVYLQESVEDLQLAVEAAGAGATLDIIAVQLQAAYAALGTVIGEEVGEDLLDEIFSQFCLGK